jgi:hypothetical protein
MAAELTCPSSRENLYLRPLGGISAARVDFYRSEVCLLSPFVESAR